MNPTRVNEKSPAETRRTLQLMNQNAVNLPNVTTVPTANSIPESNGSGNIDVNWLAAGVVTNAKLANMNDQTIKGNNSGGAGPPLDLTAAQTKAVLAITESDVASLVTDLSNKAPTSRNINTTAPITGGGNLSADRTIAISDATATVRGAVPTPPNDTTKYFRGDASWQTLNAAAAGAVPTTRNINTTAPITGGGDLSADRTIAINNFGGDSGSGGTKGAVPAPASGDTTAKKYLFADGTWRTIVTGDLPNLGGDVTGAPGANTIATNAVTNAKAAQMAANTIKGNNTAGLANAADLTVAQTKSLLAITEADISTSDVTTDNVTTAKHGFIPKAPNVATQFFDGTAAWRVLAGTDIPAINVAASGNGGITGIEPIANGGTGTNNGSMTAAQNTTMLHQGGAAAAGTDITGLDFRLAGGFGTGKGTPGHLVMKYPLKLATGTTAQSVLSTQGYVLGGVLATTTARTTVTASVVTTTETTLLGSLQGSQSLDGQLMDVGRAMHIVLMGIYTASAGPSTTFKVKIGTVTIASLVVTFGNQASQTFLIDVYLVCRTAGSSGSVIASGYVMAAQIPSGAAVQIGALAGTGGVDLTATANIDVTVTYSAGTAGNAVAIDSLLIESRN